MNKNISYLFWSNFWIGLSTVLTLGTYPGLLNNIRSLRGMISVTPSTNCQRNLGSRSDFQNLVSDVKAGVKELEKQR